MSQEQPVAATGAAATPNSGSNLEQKHAEYEQTALRLSLCSDESLAVVLRKLLPRAVMELMTCPPVSLPKASSRKRRSRSRCRLSIRRSIRPSSRRNTSNWTNGKALCIAERATS